jgi:hypothetical protein
MPTYLYQGMAFDRTHPDFQEKLRRAHAHEHRIYCLCKNPYPEMCVVDSDGKYFLRKMPKSGHKHRVACPSFEYIQSLSDLHRVYRGAITTVGDRKVVLLDFPMSEKPGQSKRRAVAESLMPPSGAVTKIRRHMPIGRLLDFIWDEAGLTKWTAGWEDSRSWGFARELMINVARNLGTRHANFEEIFFVPPAWSEARKATILKERESFLQNLRAPAGERVRFGLLVAEFDSKEVGLNRVRFKGLASPGFFLDDAASLRFDDKMADRIEMVRRVDGARLIAIATFKVLERYCAIQSIDMMPVNRQLIPFSDQRSFDLINALLGREFVKVWDYKVGKKLPAATAFLTDTVPQTALFCLNADEVPEKARQSARDEGCAAWIWSAGRERMPPLPPKSR